MAEVPIEQLTPRLWPRGDDEHTYALLDGARDPAVHAWITSSGLASRCLYIGELDPALARVAPYLVRLPRTAPASRALLERAWGEAWGVFFRSTATMEALHRHFRRLLRVQDERGVRMLFRFYDPRVLRVYLPTCFAGELEQVFGPVEFFAVESEDGAGILEFRNQRGALVHDELRSTKRLNWLGDYLRKSREEDAGKS
ncbi:MAG: hypothetical protein JWM10_2537 [Myxococcaceae bacterium]|nr:hypothetical protein [Myxococcaceae bacterium]